MREQNYCDIFRASGMKNTRCRNLIYNLLKESKLPLTSEDIFLRLRNRGEALSFSTIYRNLEAFAEKGIAARADVGFGAAYELMREGHRHHLVCKGCKKVVPIDGCPMEAYEKDLERKTNFDITEHRLEVFGYCPKCASIRRMAKE
jgi:Fur family ferric uptake transcriptional regulator